MLLKEAVNKIITKLGENPVDSVDVKHPTISIALQHIYAVNKELQIPGWWFNKYNVELYPDSNGIIKVPINTSKFVGKGHRVHIRKGRVIDTRTNKDKWDKPIKGTILEILDFEDVPEVFAEWVVSEAGIRAYIADYGMDDVVQVWKAEAYALGQLVQGEHLENVRLSTRKNRRAQSIYNWINV